MGKTQEVKVVQKEVPETASVGVLGETVVHTSAKLAWEAIRNPLAWLLYDNMVKRVDIIEDVRCLFNSS